MKKIILLFALCLPFFAYAQNDNKYLEGAVTMQDGKVTFSTEMKIPSMTKEQIYETLLDWANKRFQPDGKMHARVLYHNAEEGSIAAGGEEYIVFSASALSLDRSRIYYQLKILCEEEKCTVDMTRIRYWYNENREGGEKYDAENWIVDEWALNKAKTKLYPISGKFRRKTIDLKDELFKDIHNKLGTKMIELGLQEAPATPESKVVVTPTQQQKAPIQAVAAKGEPIKEATVETQPQPSNEESLITQAVRMTITAGNDEQFEINKECWGGFGELFGKKVTFCLIDTQKTMGNLLMTQSDNYKISFYSANNNQPTVVIQCKKLMTQNINGEEAQKMNPSCVVGKSYNMYVGEILK